jgi:hypothetical protein
MDGSDFGDPAQIIHIPARDLTGTREAKLAELDTLLAQLQMVRLALCGQPIRLEGLVGAAGQREAHRSRLRTWAADCLRAVRGALPAGAAGTRGERS